MCVCVCVCVCVCLCVCVCVCVCPHIVYIHSGCDRGVSVTYEYVCVGACVRACVRGEGAFDFYNRREAEDEAIAAMWT